MAQRTGSRDLAGMLKRSLFLAYGVLCYAVFFATFLYAVGFIGGFLVPTTLDGPRTIPLANALAIDVGLLALFAVQHSVMARRWFKEKWTRIVPPALERSTYVLFSSVALIALFALWQPLGGVIWSVSDPIARAVLYALFASGFAIVLVATFLINHFDLFGLRQVWLYFRAKPYTQLQFGTPFLYRYVRHPLYVGWFFAFWATPVMTSAHLLFAVATTAYILIAIQFEEKDLVSAFGNTYEEYRNRVPMLVPFTKGTKEKLEGAESAS